MQFIDKIRYPELLVPKNKFTELNKHNIQWFPDMDLDRANKGWVWFDNKNEYKKAKKILKEK